jgi:hypothetical protein
MLRRDSPQILAQRLTLPRVFTSALRMYRFSTSAVTSRSNSGSGRVRSTLKPERAEAGCVSSGG